MTTLLISFIAGALTIAAPCILPFLPVIIGGSAIGRGHPAQKLRPFIVSISLVVSVFIFTLLVKLTTVGLGVPTIVWQIISGGILITLGVHYIFPSIWSRISLATGLYSGSHKALDRASENHSLWGAVLLGAALGPVFNSCSPTYLFIIAQILPESLAFATVAIAAYSIGLGAALFIVSIFGRKLTEKLGWLSNPNGWFNRTVGIILLIVGIAIIFGLDKQLQSYVIEQGLYTPISNLEDLILPD